MDDFDYSLDALNVVNLFYDSKIVIYVEGEDDICFWQNIIDIAELTDCYIKNVNGSENLEPIISKIKNEGAKAIVAKDSDDTLLNANRTKHAQIVNTFGYSIENYLYCPKTINTVVNSLSKSKQDLQHAIESWYDDICDACYSLVIHNIANNMYSKGVKVFGDSCHRFLISDKSCRISKSKVEDHVSTISNKFSELELITSSSLVADFTGHKRYLIKGHFLSNSVINLIKMLVKKISNKVITLPVDNLYALTINGCLSCKQICNDLIQIIEDIKNAYQIATA